MSSTSYIQSLQVVTSSSGDQPEHCVKALGSQNPDINAGYGGLYSWLVPVMTTVPQAAATAFSVFHQSNSVPLLDDMAASTGGDYRFQVAIPDANQPNKITNVMLWRVNTDIPLPSGPPWSWDGMSANINDGRGIFGPDTNLYLLWSFSGVQGIADGNVELGESQKCET